MSISIFASTTALRPNFSAVQAGAWRQGLPSKSIVRSGVEVPISIVEGDYRLARRWGRANKLSMYLRG